MSKLRGLKLLVSYLLPVALVTGAVQASSYLDNNDPTMNKRVAAKALAGLYDRVEDIQSDGAMAIYPGAARNPRDAFYNAAVMYQDPLTSPMNKNYAAKLMAVLRLNNEVGDSELTLKQTLALVRSLFEYPQASKKQKISAANLNLKLYVEMANLVEHIPVPFELAKLVYNAEQASQVQKDFAANLIVSWRLDNKVGDSELTLSQALTLVRSVWTYRDDAALLMARVQSLSIS